MAGEIGAGSLPLYGARLVSDMDACLNRIRNIKGVTDKDGNLLIASDLESLRRSIASFVDALNAHTSNLANPHRVTAAQVGADASGTAKVLIDAHNRDSAAHQDIHQSIENMDSVCRDYIAAHNTSETAHADIREAVTAAEHSATKAGTDLAAHTSRTDNPHAVTEAQLVEASGTQAKSGKYLRVFDDDSSTGAYSNEKLTFFGKTIFRGETECGETKAGSIEVTGGAIVHAVLAVFGGSFYLEDLENPGSMYEMSVRGGKLYFNNDPITSDYVRSLKA